MNFCTKIVIEYCLLTGKHFINFFNKKLELIMIDYNYNLLQRRDDDVPIYLVKPITEIREMFNQRIKEIAKEMTDS